MINFYRIILSMAAGFAMALSANARIVINEIMQSNIDCIMDDIQEFPDSWVELYNDSETSVSTSGLRIGITEDPSTSWDLPSATIAAKGYYLVYCDKAGTNWRKNHTDFRLESGKGCQVYLFKGSELIDKIEGLKKQPAPNISYGRVNDGGDSFGYQLTSSPGGPNVSGVSAELLPLPVFSHKGHVLTTPITLDITLPSGCPEGSVVRYTLDGSEPGEESDVWSRPMEVSTSTVVRAKVMCEGCLSPRSLTHSYIFHPNEMTLPIVSLVTDDAYFYDEELGIYTEDNKADAQRNWRRPLNFELFDVSKPEAVLNQLCETRVKGQFSRNESLKSLVIYANKRFGEKRLNYEFFPEDAPGFTDWKSIELRNAGNDFNRAYMRDGLLQRIGGRACDLDYQPFAPAVVYVNGKYLGMLNIRSRSNEDHIYTFYDGLENIDLIEVINVEVKAGDRVEYDRLMQMAADGVCKYSEFEEAMDIDEYVNYVILNLAMNNQDWPGNNAVMWRERSEIGKWRWICKDMDYAAGNFEIAYDYPTYNWFYDPAFDSTMSWASSLEDTRLLRTLMEFDEFRTKFFSRLCALLGGPFSPSATTAMLDEIAEHISSEIALHRTVHSTTWPKWQSSVEKLRKWLVDRPDFFYSHTAEYFGLGTPTPLSVKVGAGVSELSIAGMDISDAGFVGKWFSGNNINLSGSSDEGGFEIAWDVEICKDGISNLGRHIGGNINLRMPECERVNVYVSLVPSSVSSVKGENINDAAVYDLSGRKVSSPLQPGVYICGGKKFIVGASH